MFSEMNLFGKNMLLIRILQDHDTNKKTMIKIMIRIRILHDPNHFEPNSLIQIIHSFD